MARAPDNIFEHPRLAAIYDALDADRSDLDVYVAIAEELGARRVLDVGCGTGTFALLLADRGLEVTGLDPAGGSLRVARAKAGSERVRWIHGDAKALPSLRVDLATMTGNVAQAIVEPSDWEETLRGVYEARRASRVRDTRSGKTCVAGVEPRRVTQEHGYSGRWRGRELGGGDRRQRTARHIPRDLGVRVGRGGLDVGFDPSLPGA